MSPRHKIRFANGAHFGTLRGGHPIAGKVDDFDDGFDAFVAQSTKNKKINPTTPFWRGEQGSTPSVQSPKLTTTWGKHFPDEFIRGSGVSYDQDPRMPVVIDDPKAVAKEKAEYNKRQIYFDARRAHKFKT